MLIKRFQNLNLYSYGYESDFSTYDATNNYILRMAYDGFLFDHLHNLEVLQEDLLDPNFQDDSYYEANVNCRFSSCINHPKTKQPIFKCKGTILGTTYSGHPTCTTNCGTGRNLAYHLFAINRNLNRFSFFN